MTPKHRATRRNLFDATQDALPDPQGAASGNERAPASSLQGTVRKQAHPAQPAPSESRRKIQVSRSHPFHFNHFSRILALLLTQRNAVKVPRKDIIEQTGLPDGQVASLLSIGAAMGLIQPVRQTLTATGLLIAQRDLFLEDKGTTIFVKMQILTQAAIQG